MHYGYFRFHYTTCGPQSDTFFGRCILAGCHVYGSMYLKTYVPLDAVAFGHWETTAEFLC